jgi:hypothetical protein
VFDHRPHDLRLDVRVFASIGDHRRVASRREGHLGRGCELREKGVAQIVDDEPINPTFEVRRLAAVRL